MKVFFGGLVIVFVFWGVGAKAGKGKNRSDALALVNGEPINEADLRSELMRINGGKRGQSEDEERAQRQQAMTALIEDSALTQMSEKLGIEVSTEEIARVVLQQKVFLDDKGKFSEKLYDRTLKNMGQTKGTFEESVREGLLRQKLVNVARETVQISDEQVLEFQKEQATQVELRWVTLTDAAMLPLVPVADSAIDALLATDAARVKDAYDKDFDRLYNVPEQDELDLILLRNDLGASPEALRAHADAVLASARAGADFASLAQHESEDLTAALGGYLGKAPSTALDPAVAKAVVATSAGAITDIVETGRGLQILHVRAKEPGRVIPLEEAQRQIAHDIIAKDEVGKVGGELGEQILKEWKLNDAPPEALLTEKGLSIKSVPAFSIGRPPPALPPSEALLTAMKKATKPGVLDGVYPTEDGRVIAEIARLDAPAAPSADDLKMARARLEMEAMMKFLTAWRAEVVAQSEVVQNYKP